ncbi:MAG: ABC transporter ATP-binding protein [Sediminicola sp.]|tara:strand:- start:37761 stop:38738 length:978 start_codon:yes stop_codon:yes gene_type:complete
MLEVKGVSFGYSDSMVLEDIGFNLGKGEHVSIIGESGCGKSTLLKIIYGLLQLKQGSVSWNGNQVLGPDFNLVPGEKHMKYLSQDFDLMPFTTVEENVGHFLSVFHPEEMRDRTHELLHLLEMQDFANTKVKNLSGGQQQRIALARVLAQEPEVLLLDEPFGHIDNFRKNSLRRSLFAHLKKKRISCLVASHDADDILPFSDQVMVLKDKKMLAFGTPQELYQKPKTRYVASLFGEVNLVPISWLKQYSEIDRSILVYPHEFQTSEKSGLKVQVERSFYKGSHYLNQARVYEGTETLFFNSKGALTIGDDVFLNVSLETINLRLT